MSNGLPAGSKDINAEIVTDYWDALYPRLPISCALSRAAAAGNNASATENNRKKKNSKNSTTKKKTHKPKQQLVVTALFATRDIQVNEEIFIEYGALPPSSFLIKYGCIPEQYLTEPQLMAESIMLLYPPKFIPNPTDTTRIQALQKNDLPTTLENGLDDALTTWLYPYDLSPLVEQHTAYMIQSSRQSKSGGGSSGTTASPPQSFDEPDSLKLLRQYLTVAIVGDDRMIQIFLKTSRLRGEIDPRRVGKCLIDVIDYNLSLYSKCF